MQFLNPTPKELDTWGVDSQPLMRGALVAAALSITKPDQ
jgi:hypothetical protein